MIKSRNFVHLLLTAVVSAFLFSCANQTALEKSISRLVEEANEGKTDSAHALCYRYTNGVNVEQNNDEAFKWCTRAAASQNPKSSTLLADCYYHGIGTDVDYRKAAKLYYYAAERGVEKAMFMMYHIYHNGHGVAKDDTEAKYYLNRAASRNYAPAQQLKQQLELEDSLN